MEFHSSWYGVFIVPQWCRKEVVPEHMDACLWDLLYASRSVPTRVHGMVEVDPH